MALATLTFVTLLITSSSLRAQAGAQASAQAPRTVQDGVYSDAQASRGQALYALRCTGCHGPALAGASAPALTGDLFTNKFRVEPLSALFIQIRYAMPPKAEANAQLTSEQAADLVAHVLKSNGFPRPARPTSRRLMRRTARSGGRLVTEWGQAARPHRVGIRRPAISLN